MIVSLYEPFKKWSELGSVWLISDPHFEDEDTKIMNPNWIDSEDHLKVINNMIVKNDTLVCLGDCGNLEYFQRMKVGYKVLIKGNHDQLGDSKYKREIKKYVVDADKYSAKEVKEKFTSENPNCVIRLSEEWSFHSPFHRFVVCVDNNLFDEVYSGPLFVTPQVLLSHEPVYGLRFCTNIHGHVHNGVYDYSDAEGARHLNIASDVIQYQPVSLGKLIKAGLVAGVPTIHRITIDRAIENPIHNKE